jgi:multidrug resistance efflux pump
MSKTSFADDLPERPEGGQQTYQEPSQVYQVERQKFLDGLASEAEAEQAALEEARAAERYKLEREGLKARRAEAKRGQNDVEEFQNLAAAGRGGSQNYDAVDAAVLQAEVNVAEAVQSGEFVGSREDMLAALVSEYSRIPGAVNTDAETELDDGRGNLIPLRSNPSGAQVAGGIRHIDYGSTRLGGYHPSDDDK